MTVRLEVTTYFHTVVPVVVALGALAFPVEVQPLQAEQALHISLQIMQVAAVAVRLEIIRAALGAQVVVDQEEPGLHLQPAMVVLALII